MSPFLRPEDDILDAEIEPESLLIEFDPGSVLALADDQDADFQALDALEEELNALLDLGDDYSF